MKCLIDADVLLHEIGWSGQFKDKETGEEVLLPFEEVALLLDKKIKIIEEDCYADEPSVLFISPSPTIVEMWNKYPGNEPMEFIPNFRYEVGITKPYKGTRKNPKPFHFYNIVAYMMAMYDVVIATDGLEADDAICIAQKKAIKNGEETTICSRDKDLRICEGWHYSWECGRQLSMGPHQTDVFGSLGRKKNGDVFGYGLKFFFYQLLCGDAADNIPGLPGVGTVGAYKAIVNTVDHAEAFSVVRDMYKEKLGDESKTYFLEQAQLLWMRHADNEPFDIRKL